MQIREFTLADYDAITVVHNTLYPDERRLAAAWQELDAQHDSRYLKRAWVAEVNGGVVGRALYDQYAWEYDPRAFQFEVAVLPDFQCQGIGTALYETLVTALVEYQPIRLRTETRSTWPGAVHFLEKRGYTAYNRMRRSTYPVADFDSAPYRDLETKLEAQGITIKTLGEMESDPDHLRKIYDLDKETTSDEPDMSFTPPPFDEMIDWLNRTLDAGRIHADGYLLAVHGNNIIGQTYLMINPIDQSVHVGTTGVARDFRRLGIATMLKVRSLQFAQAKGYQTMLTENEVRNVPIRELNQRLGFVPQYDLIRYAIYTEYKETIQ